ncbi:MAG: radical SAM protein [Actinomycetota bacterium]|nr:radical SAM protein [Actinomycetota bacterium]
MSAVAEAVAEGRLPGRVWCYSNYHCNLVCTYCLTDSSPKSPRRDLAAERMIELATQAADLGFTDLGVTGGEPFLRPEMVDILLGMAERLPTVVLSNATLFHGDRLKRVEALADQPVVIQVSLDYAEPADNDAQRGDDNHATVVGAISRLVERGIRVRIGTTLDPEAEVSDDEQARLCTLHRSLGVSDEDHVVRPIVRRGRADVSGMGVRATAADLPPELTVTADGAWWSPFGPTIRDGVPETDLLITRTTDPLSVPASALLRLVEGRPAGEDANLGIR